MTQHTTEINVFRLHRSSFHFDPNTLKLLAPHTPEACKEHEQLQRAALLLQQGKVIAMPTETVYGLAANAFDAAAVSSIFRLKKRPADNPLILHFSCIEQIKECGLRIPPIYESLVAKGWPGPLTILLEKPSSADLKFATEVSRTTRLAVRIPSHPIARALIAIAGRPLAAPSANRSGRVSPTRAEHVLQDFQVQPEQADVEQPGLCLVVADADEYLQHENGWGLESTVVDALSDPPVILRPGGLTVEEVRQVKGFEKTLVYQQPNNYQEKDNEQIPTTPGMKYTHYAPVYAQVVLLPAGCKSWSESIQKDLDQHPTLIKLAVLCSSDLISNEMEEFKKVLRERYEVEWYPVEGDSLSFARHLFHALRTLDERRVNVIYVQPFPEQGQGWAIMNRLRKAAQRVL